MTHKLRENEVRASIRSLLAAGYSIDQIAKHIGVSSKTIYRYATGASRPVSTWITAELAKLVSSMEMTHAHYAR